jgi:hypothetical protein
MTINNIYIVNTTPAEIAEAKRQAEEMGRLRNSITKGNGNVVGFLGEIAVARLMHARQQNTYQYDLVMENGKTIDVKSKKCLRPPRMDYDATISNFNTKQNCDYYVFARVSDDLSKVYVMGIIGKEDYFKKSTFYEAGDLDPNSTPTRPFYFQAASHNLVYHRLNDIKTMVDRLPEGVEIVAGYKDIKTGRDIPELKRTHPTVNIKTFNIGRL